MDWSSAVGILVPDMAIATIRQEWVLYSDEGRARRGGERGEKKEVEILGAREQKGGGKEVEIPDMASGFSCPAALTPGSPSSRRAEGKASNNSDIPSNVYGISSFAVSFTVKWK